MTKEKKQLPKSTFQKLSEAGVLNFESAAGKFSHKRIFPLLLLVAFGFSLQSFIGVRIEKRHYRKGYYVHIWHNPKTKPIHTASESSVVKERKKVPAPPVVQQRQEPQRSSNEKQHQRNVAPVSQARSNDN